MTDEEKKAIQMIKNQKEEVDDALIAMEIPENYIGEDVEQEYLEWQKNAKIILNLIEKQEKEIEELRNEVMEKELIIDGMKEDRRIAVEEIQEQYFVSKEESEQKEKKAYIDGINIAHNLCNKKWEDKIKAKIEEVKDGTFDAKIVLQSLLEKE